MMSNNKQIYSTLEFEDWAYKELLLDEEKYLIENHLDRSGKTLEAGTGGGRILLEMNQMGFTSLCGYDYVPDLIEQAKQRDSSGSICFEVGDATNLKYGDNDFNQIVYLQQILCFIEDSEARLKALKEAYRILEKGGTALFSFLSFHARTSSAVYSVYLMYLRGLRSWRGSTRSLQYLPWLKHGGKINWSAFLDREPYVYWYKLEEADRLLKEVNFEVVAVGSDFQLRQGKIHKSIETLVKEPIEGMLYFVCKK